MSEGGGVSYRDAGVDIDAGQALVRAIAPLARNTARPGAEAALGGYGAVFDPKAAGFQDPLLIASTDGVGTKLRVAIEAGHHDTVGIDLVAMCVNDLVVQNAEPLFFLDYYAAGRLDVATARAVISGIAEGCELAGCALIGGESAEMPGFYAPGDHDLAGFAVGAVERGGLLPDTASLAAGDVLIGLPSAGLHSNGYSLVRRVVADQGLSYSDPAPFAPEMSLARALLTPTRVYVRPALAAVRTGGVKALAHVTGGGLSDNLPRVLPEHLAATVDVGAWWLPPVMAWLRSAGPVADGEMLRTFNCGIGMTLIVAPGQAESICHALAEQGESPVVMGQLQRRGDGPAVTYEGLEAAWG